MLSNIVTRTWTRVVDLDGCSAELPSTLRDRLPHVVSVADLDREPYQRSLVTTVHEDRYEFEVAIGPSLSPSAIRRLGTDRAYWEFARTMGEVRYARSPNILRNLSVGIGHYLQHASAREIQHRRSGSFSPYKPDGFWEYVPSTEPLDWVIRARATIERLHEIEKPLPDLLVHIMKEQRPDGNDWGCRHVMLAPAGWIDSGGHVLSTSHKRA